MSCLCDKLRREDFAALTNQERELLNRLFSKAPQLFSPILPQSRKRRSEQSDNEIQPYHLQKVDELEKTYPCPNTQQVLDGRGVENRLLDLASQTDVYVRIFLAVEQSDQVIALNQLIKRLHCFALAQLHPKGSPIEPIVERIQHSVRNVQNINQKVYNMLWVGRQWNKIAKTLGAVASNVESSNPVIGVLCLLGTGSTWERASDEARELALRRLCKKTDLHRQAIKYDGLVDSTVKRILDQRPSAQLGPGSHSARPTIGLQLTRHVFLPPILFGQARQASTLPNAESLAASDAAVLKATPIGTENKLLLILLSFLSDSQVSVDMFFQAAMPRRGWATDGGVESSSSEWVLGHTLSTNATIKAAFDRLVELSLISSTADARYSVNANTRTMILNTLPLELHSFWRQQALYVACAAIPWKYLHSPNLQIRETIKPHIIHTLNAVRDCDGYESVPLDYMTGLVSALAEASRFSGLKWKRTMITEARKILSHSSNDYLELLIVQREVLLDRLSKEPATTVTLNQDLNNDRRTHAASGSAIIQEALNHFQNEELSLALSTMNKWSPMQDPVSTLENIIIFRINILRGKILRYQGKFEDAVQSLRLSQDLIKAHKEIYFDEDIGDLISELADTLQELGDFAHSEALLRTQLSQDNTPATKVILQLSLMECLFAQQNVAGAEVYYADLKKCDTMTKMARLRLCIIAAKLCHVQSNLTDAFAWWTEALQAMNKFPPTSGNATCIIYLSLCDVLKRQGQKDLEQSSRIELAKLQSLSSHAEAKYWIAGLRRWHEYISSPSS